MRVHVISDVHGNVDALTGVADGADALVVLGDLLDFVDYANPAGGILGRLFGAEKVQVFAELRKQHDPVRTSAYTRSLWESLDDPAAAVDDAIAQQHAELFGALRALDVPTYVIPGNVDAPQQWPQFAGDGVHIADGEAVTIGGLRFGFVGGGLRPAGFTPRPSAPWRPHLRERAEFDAAVDNLGAVDVLGSHIPPDLGVLTYDVVARRHERGSDRLADHIRQHRPRWSLFGHVHQPLAQRARLNGTECCNVGHFKTHQRAFVLRW